MSSRIWPARDYTRLTLESRSAIKHSIFSVKEPERLVLELETDELSPALAELQGKVAAEDPYIQGLRVARNRPGVIRVVAEHRLSDWNLRTSELDKLRRFVEQEAPSATIEN